MTDETISPEAEQDEDSQDVLDILRDRITGKIVPEQGGSGLLVLGLVIFGIVQALGSDFLYALTIIPILLVHELGHLAAMKAFGYRNVSIFFIPFFGALTSGIRTDPSRSKDAIVSLSGPAVGIAVSILVAYVNKFHHSKILISFAIYGLTINLFNLLPILPFDGGKFWDSVLASRNHVLSIAFKALTVAALLAVGAKFEDWIFLLLAFSIGMQVREQWIERKASRLVTFRNRHVEEITREQIRSALAAVEELTQDSDPQKRIARIVERTVRLCQNLSVPPAGAAFTAISILGYLLMSGIGILFLFLCMSAKSRYGL